MLQDLKNASKGDVVFTSGKPPKGKRLNCGDDDLLPNMFLVHRVGLDEEVNRVATDSANLVSAYKELNNCRHQNELPSTIDQVQQHIAELKTIIPRSDETQS